MKVVLDTNIWISGILLPESQAGKVLLAWRNTKFQISTSQFILDEIKRVLLYPKIQKRINWDENRIDQYLLFLKFFTDFIITNQDDAGIALNRDPNDTLILKTFIESHADYLVTGDNDLLELKEKYSVTTLTEFYQMLF